MQRRQIWVRITRDEFVPSDSMETMGAGGRNGKQGEGVDAEPTIHVSIVTST